MVSMKFAREIFAPGDRDRVRVHCACSCVWPQLTPLHVLPRLPLISRFPALATRYMFSRACHSLHAFPRLPPVTCFLMLDTRYTLSRACHPLHVFTRLILVACFPTVATCYLFSCACLSLYVIPVLDTHHMLFPRLIPVSRFPALSRRCMLSRACHPLHDIIPALDTISYNSYALISRHTFPRLKSVTCFPEIFTQFSQSYLEQFDPVHRQFDKNKTAVRQEHFFDILWNLSNKFIGQTCHDNVWAILWLLDANLATQQVTWMNSLLKSYGVLHSLHPQFTLFPPTSPSRVFSMRPLTPRASSAFLSFISWAEMIGVLMDRDALMISFMRGTPSVMSDFIKKTN